MRIFIFCFLLFAASSNIVLGQSKIKSFTKTGDQMPQFSVKDTDKNQFDISVLRGKLLFINFWATWCGPCLEEMPLFESQVWQKHKNSPNFRMVAIARGETLETILPFKNNFKLTFPFASDPDREIFKLFGDSGLPRSYVVGTDGMIIFQSVGLNNLEIKKLIAFIDSEMEKLDSVVK